MSTNRRKFLRAGTLAAIAVAIPLKAFGQGVRKGSDGNPIDSNPPELAPDALANYNKAAFTSYLNSVFRLYAGYSTIDVTLIEIKDLMPAGAVAQNGAECFSLLFRGGTVALPQNTYEMGHPSLGAFQLFLVPGKPDDNGGMSFVAIINRLPYSASLIDAPTRISKPSEPVSPQPSNPSPTITRSAPSIAPSRAINPSKKIGVDDELFERLINW
jgi:hypothetical protein